MMSPPAASVSDDPAPEAVIKSPIDMRLTASSVNEWADAHVTGPETVTFPASVPRLPASPVETNTLVVPSRVLSVPLLMTDVPVGTHLFGSPPSNAPFPCSPVVMKMSNGSSSSVPVLPSGAVRSAPPVKLSTPCVAGLAETST